MGLACKDWLTTITSRYVAKVVQETAWGFFGKERPQNDRGVGVAKRECFIKTGMFITFVYPDCSLRWPEAKLPPLNSYFGRRYISNPAAFSTAGNPATAFRSLCRPSSVNSAHGIKSGVRLFASSRGPKLHPARSCSTFQRPCSISAINSISSLLKEMSLSAPWRGRTPNPTNRKTSVT